jgi:energy-coupling factor transporter ATP-binding protein EcfA2
MSETALSKAIESELGKAITTKIFGKLSNFVMNRGAEREAQEIFDNIKPVAVEDQQAIFEKVTNRYLTFRTLMSRDNDVFIDDIYHPLRVSISNDINDSVLIEKNTEFKHSKIACIVGKAGQGKTTLLRKMFLNQIIGNTDQFPLIITLRKIDWSTQKLDVPTIISNEFRNLGVTVSPLACSYLMQYQRIKIFYDGFDEVETIYRGYALSIIIDTHVSFNSKCIVTTRPGTEIQLHSGEVINYWLMDLLPTDVAEIIKVHPFVGAADKKQLLDVIKTKKDISAILLTPIIVDIFISTYNSLIADPTSIIDFYEQLFQTLSSSHDRLKILFKRSGISGLSNKQLEQVFCTASYLLLKKRNDITFRETELESACDEAVKLFKFEAEDSHVDIIDKTSLIKRDGNDYSYIHKSILEFHAAKHIANLSDETRTKYYYQILTSYSANHENILRYLSKIDTDLFYIVFVKQLTILINDATGIFSSELRNTVTSHLFIAISSYDSIRINLNEGVMLFSPQYELKNSSILIRTYFMLLFSIFDIVPPRLKKNDLEVIIYSRLVHVDLKNKEPIKKTDDELKEKTNLVSFEVDIEEVIDFSADYEKIIDTHQLIEFFDSIHKLSAEVESLETIYKDRNTSEFL